MNHSLLLSLLLLRDESKNGIAANSKPPNICCSPRDELFAPGPKIPNVSRELRDELFIHIKKPQIGNGSILRDVSKKALAANVKPPIIDISLRDELKNGNNN